MSLPSRLACVAFGLALAGPLLAQEILSRGPLHEAFVQPVEAQPRPTPPVTKEPPAPPIELQPEQRPAGDGLRWLPGYWAWEGERGDFVWVSGFYRQPPAERQYVPGRWTRTDAGWRRVPGYWAPANQKEPTPLPEPPVVVDRGPAGAAPDEHSVYRPGYWRYEEDRFLWQAGGWDQAVPDRVRVQPRYQWTPQGYVFVDGYLDYPLEGRGQLYPPLAFRTPPTYYRPRYALNLDTMTSAFFHQVGTYQYSFGDYFGSNHRDAGYQPWFAGAGKHDPLFGYYQWFHRSDPNWAANLQRSYEARAAGRVPAPVQILEGQGRADPPPSLAPLALANGAGPGQLNGPRFAPAVPILYPRSPQGGGYVRRPRPLTPRR